MIIFLASWPMNVRWALRGHNAVLCAMSELQHPKNLRVFDDVVQQADYTLVDSGVFALVNAHARKHDLTMDEALRVPINALDGFDELLKQYILVIGAYHDRLFGYIEIDAGGTDQKRKTRALLEAEGLSPMPVYHPLNDGWDYFDELASNYERICVGNLVFASRSTRLRLLATISERRQKYPSLKWIHALGVGAHDYLNSFDIDSADASNWVMHARFGRPTEVRAAMKQIGHVRLTYESMKDDETGAPRAYAASAVNEQAHHRGWRAYKRVLGLERT